MVAEHWVLEQWEIYVPPWVQVTSGPGVQVVKEWLDHTAAEPHQVHRPEQLAGTRPQLALLGL